MSEPDKAPQVQQLFVQQPSVTLPEIAGVQPAPLSSSRKGRNASASSTASATPTHTHGHGHGHHQTPQQQRRKHQPQPPPQDEGATGLLLSSSNARSSRVTSAKLRRTGSASSTGSGGAGSAGYGDAGAAPGGPAAPSTGGAAAGAAATIGQATALGSSVSPASSRPRPEFPMTPGAAVERFKRVLTPFELSEIKGYPQVYYLGPLARKIHGSEAKGNNFGYDDDKARYRCIKHDHIAYRYEILKGLGKGSFGDVVKTYDHKTKTHLALKIIRNERRFHKQGQVEVKLLDLLRKQDKRNSHNIIHMRDYFLFRNHLCITFELLGSDLYSALKKDGFSGYEVPKVRKFAAGLLSCLRVLRRSRIIHCDLKPENILLKGKGDGIKVIDFGSACFDHQKVHSYIQSRFYRSPEVILGASYGVPIDMWSLGCILAELHTGHPIFPGRDEKEQLMYQMELLGVPPASYVLGLKRAGIFFSSAGQPRFLTDRKGRLHEPGSKSFERALKTDDPRFVDFLRRCLEWDPAQRMTPKEALKHPFVVGNPPRKLSRAVSEGSRPPVVPNATLPRTARSQALQTATGKGLPAPRSASGGAPGPTDKGAHGARPRKKATPTSVLRLPALPGGKRVVPQISVQDSSAALLVQAAAERPSSAPLAAY